MTPGPGRPTPPHSTDDEPPTVRRGASRGLSGVAVLVALALACMAAPLMVDGTALRRFDADPVAAALVDGRGSLSFALPVAALAGALGVGWAVLARLLGERAERRLAGTAARLAGLPLALLVPLAGGLGGGPWTLALAVALSAAPAVAALAHAELRHLARAEFLAAARAAGLHGVEVARRHLIPNAARPLAAAALLALPRVLAAESFASLLGLGLAPVPGSWGASAGLAARLGDPVALAAPALLLALALWASCAVADAAVASGGVASGAAASGRRP